MKKTNIKTANFIIIGINILILMGCTAVEIKKESKTEFKLEKRENQKQEKNFLIKSNSGNLGKIKAKQKDEDNYEAKTAIDVGSYEFVIQDMNSQENYICDKIMENSSTSKLKKAIGDEKSIVYIARSSKYLFNIKKNKEGEYELSITESKPYKEVQGKVDGKIEWRNNMAVVKAENIDGIIKKYTMESTVPPRNSTLNGNKSTFEEFAGKPFVRSGNTMFDALFALSIYESWQNSVSEITDGSFNNGNPVKLDAFQTGEDWHYVWTRDTAYSVALSLGFMDPVRSKNSLEYKVSEKRAEKNILKESLREIIQDTGSGGSWPISSDRVTWALGAWETLKFLEGEKRAAFFQVAHEAIINTIENDRIAVYDERDGLYKGEQSFLDWREQTYPLWTQSDTAHIGMSKALSTNCAHYAALIIASNMADEKQETEKASKYRKWAEKLKEDINREFWLKSKNLYSSMKGTEFDNYTAEKYDALGEALAVITGVADKEKAEQIVSSYPHVEAGPPVIWPQLPDVAPYHNRAIWPFVTAFTIKAGIKAKNTEVVSHNIRAMITAAALNISNMENYEFLSGQHSFTDKLNGSGPVINSKRQLWSVAGYISMIIEGIFGFNADQNSISFNPFITAKTRNEFFKESDKIILNNLDYKGKIINIEIKLPKKSDNDKGYYSIESILVNGKATEKKSFSQEDFINSKNTVEITLGKSLEGNEKICMADLQDYRNIEEQEYRKIFVPREPKVEINTNKAGNVELKIDPNKEKNVVYNIYKNGVLYDSGVKESIWTEKDAPVDQKRKDRFSFSVNNEKLKTNIESKVMGAKTKYFSKWGKSEEIITTDVIKPKVSGNYYLTIIYANAHNSVNTGITACVKKVEVLESGSGKIIQTGIVTMPHLNSWNDWGESTVLQVSLEKDKEYSVKVSDYKNMSYFNHFAIYNGEGGIGGAVNTANISEIKMWAGYDYYSVESEYPETGNKSHHSTPKKERE